MSKWAGIAIVGIWVGMGIMSFNLGVKEMPLVVFLGFIATIFAASAR